MARIYELDVYQQMSRRTIPTDKEKAELLANFAMGLSGEAGEVTDLLKKHLFHGHHLDKGELKKELGDVLFYLAGLATLAGIDLSQVATANVAKLLERYPDGFDKNKSINRKESQGA